MRDEHEACTLHASYISSDTHSNYVQGIVFQRQQQLHNRTTM
jgi:hypothetical protein